MWFCLFVEVLRVLRGLLCLFLSIGCFCLIVLLVLLLVCVFAFCWPVRACARWALSIVRCLSCVVRCTLFVWVLNCMVGELVLSWMAALVAAFCCLACFLCFACALAGAQRRWHCLGVLFGHASLCLASLIMSFLSACTVLPHSRTTGAPIA